MRPKTAIRTAGVDSLIIYFDANSSEDTLNWIIAADAYIRQQLKNILIDTVPSYQSLLVLYDLDKIRHRQIVQELQRCLQHCPQPQAQSSKVVELPVYYGEEVAPDMARVAKKTGLNPEQITNLHQQRDYRVYALGFAPGFAYLGELEAKLRVPRLTTPRAQVQAGALGIADAQTAVYPTASPGGWNIIGNCPVQMMSKKPLLNVGDRVRFCAIDRQQFEQMKTK